MRRTPMTPRPDWREKADAAGFLYHSEGGTYWDESAAYVFDLRKIEDDIEPAAEVLHELCLDLADEAVRSEQLMTRLAIPAEHWDVVAASWWARDPTLYGRFDLFYDGSGPPKLYEYNADTPTSIYEAAVFQWLWLEDMIGSGGLPAGADQFNSLFESLRDRFAAIFPRDTGVHFAAEAGSVEDRQTVRFFEDLAVQAGLRTRYLDMAQIGVRGDGRFADVDGDFIEAAFKLYPWEDMLREPFARHLLGAGVKWLEPPWKALLSNKGVLPLLWQRHTGHPNLLAAVFDDDPRAAELGPAYVRKPLFSREGADVEVVGAPAEPPVRQGYGAEGWIRQAYQPPPEFEGRRPVLGAWIVGAKAAGLSIREDDGVVTKNSARFVPHYIDG